MTDAASPGTSEPRIVVQTPFGDLVADARNLVRFPAGLPGFEGCHWFVLLSSPLIAPLHVLQSVDGIPASFFGIDPRLVVPGYDCELASMERARLDATGDVALLWLALLSADAEGRAHANLRAPIVVNPAAMVGYQVVTDNPAYAVRHRLAAE